MGEQLIAKWQKILEISDWTIRTKRILPEQIIYNGEKYFIGICREFDKKEGTIYYDIDLTEEAIVHELLHVAYPEKDEEWVVAKTEEYLNPNKGEKSIE